MRDASMPALDPVARPSDAPARTDGGSTLVSVVVPVTERCDDLAALYRDHAGVLRGSGRAFEFVFVVDGGFEAVVPRLEALARAGEPVRIVRLPRHFGEATALMVGLGRARGELIVTLSAYFQAAPAGLEALLARLGEGWDLAVSRRHPRVDSWINRLQNWGFHALTRRLSGVDLHDMSCGLRAMRRPVAHELELYGDLHRFIPLLAYQRGFRVTEVSVPQHADDTRTRLRRPGTYLRRLLDILTLVFLFKFVKKPLRFFGLIGAGLFGAGLAVSLALTVERVLGITALTERPLLVLGVLLMVLGVQVGSIGLLGEMIVFTHARHLKDYAIDKILG
jgi:glycosyltransferase involved in cell wall biosynthesis